MEKTTYHLQIIFDSDKPPRKIDGEKVQTALLTALAISVGGNIKIIGGNMKLDVYQQTLADIPEEFWKFTD